MTGSSAAASGRSAPRLVVGRGPQWGVGQRLVALVTLVLAAGLILAGLTTYLIQRGDLEERTDAELLQEVEELRTRAGQARSDGGGYREVSVLLEDFLQSNVPGSNEAMAVFDAGERKPALVSGGERQVDLVEPAVLDVIAEARRPGSTQLRSVQTETQDLRLAVTSVQGDASEGTFVVAIDRGARLSQLHRIIQVYAIAAALTLALSALVLHVAVRRLIAPLGDLVAATESVDDRDLSRRVEVPRQETEVAALARTVNRMLDRLEHSFVGQRRFLDDTAHELRTPLTIMRGNLEVLDPCDVEDVETTVAIELGEIDRMRRIVDDLLLLARLDRPDFVRPRPTDVAQLHRDLLALVPGLGDREWANGGQVSGSVELDRDRVSQAVQQLCANAVHFSHEGSRVALRSSWRGAGAQRELAIAVTDTGVGIAEEDQERVFERFYRSAEQSGDGGSGLGLPVVRAIAEAHGGHVELDSRLGTGTTVTIVLPAPEHLSTDQPGADRPGTDQSSANVMTRSTDP